MDVVVIIVLLGGSILFFLFHLRHPPKIDIPMQGKGGILTIFWPGICWCYGCIQKKGKLRIDQKRRERIGRLYVGKKPEEVFASQCCQVGCELAVGVIGMFLVLFLILLLGPGTGLLKDVYYLKRGEPGQASQSVSVQVRGGEEQKDITVEIPSRVYTAEETKAKMEEARKYVEAHYLGENTDAMHVTSPLALVSALEGNQVQIKWKLDASGLVRSDGSLSVERIEKETPVTIRAELSYGEEKQTSVFELTLLPPVMTEAQRFWKEWLTQARSLAQASKENSYLELPQKVGQTALVYRERQGRPEWDVLFAGLLILVLIPVCHEYQERKKERNREKELRLDYPELMERFILLIGAGMTVKGAWIRITRDYEQKRKQKKQPKQYLYEEMLLARREMENGQNEAEVYEHFGRRVMLLSYMKFSTLLVQNLKKGSDDLLQRMEYEAVDAIRERRENARMLGEEAGTKLLFPMMLLLIIVFAMIMVAAFSSMQ